MMSIKISLFMLLAIAFLLPSTITSVRNTPILANDPKTLDLVTRLQVVSNNDTNTTTANCWSSLSELRNCSNEIVGFFLNGYTELNTPCCEAIQTIIGHCWPSMITVLGFTTEEGNVLAAYCGKIFAPVGAPPDVETTLGSHS